jgi:hypothetical protein
VFRAKIMAFFISLPLAKVNVMNLTKIIRPYFIRRIRQINAAASDTEATQRGQLQDLIHEARDTVWGRDHGYGSISNYNDFRQRVDITPYEQIRLW